ncbi:hypothetical protein G5I_13627 [Acromyrmex echinatior]|uniref:Uncharacterized protein n=1 Tax=Acromyrmex echinatior TaxID=103372 RepID=F4X5J3_ACREC|nr:hypothetical protein G5I_13627 [Acromyrmex echinatior]
MLSAPAESSLLRKFRRNLDSVIEHVPFGPRTYIFPMLLSLLLPKLEDPSWMQLDEGITFFSAIYIAESQQNHAESSIVGFVDGRTAVRKMLRMHRIQEKPLKETFHGYDTHRAVSLFTEIIEYLQTDLAPVIEHILLNAALFAFYLRVILAKSKSIIDTIWISGLSYARDVQMNLVLLVSDHDSSGNIFYNLITNYNLLVQLGGLRYHGRVFIEQSESHWQ